MGLDHFRSLFYIFFYFIWLHFKQVNPSTLDHAPSMRQSLLKLYKPAEDFFYDCCVNGEAMRRLGEWISRESGVNGRMEKYVQK